MYINNIVDKVNELVTIEVKKLKTKSLTVLENFHKKTNVPKINSKTYKILRDCGKLNGSPFHERLFMKNKYQNIEKNKTDLLNRSAPRIPVINQYSKEICEKNNNGDSDIWVKLSGNFL